MCVWVLRWWCYCIEFLCNSKINSFHFIKEAIYFKIEARGKIKWLNAHIHIVTLSLQHSPSSCLSHFVLSFVILFRIHSKYRHNWLILFFCFLILFARRRPPQYCDIAFFLYLQIETLDSHFLHVINVTNTIRTKKKEVFQLIDTIPYVWYANTLNTLARLLFINITHAHIQYRNVRFGFTPKKKKTYKILKKYLITKMWTICRWLRSERLNCAQYIKSAQHCFQLLLLYHNSVSMCTWCLDVHHISYLPRIPQTHNHKNKQQQQQRKHKDESTKTNRQTKRCAVIMLLLLFLFFDSRQRRSMWARIYL